MTYPAAALEGQVLDVLRELDTAKLMGDDSNDGNDVMTWEGRVQEIDRQTAELTEALAGRDVKAVVDRLAALEFERVEAVEGLEAAKRQAAVPSSESWGVIKGKVDMKDEGTRLRLRNAVRQVVEMSIASSPVTRAGGTSRGFAWNWPANTTATFTSGPTTDTPEARGPRPSASCGKMTRQCTSTAWTNR